MTERVLVIKEEHLAMVMAEYYKRARENADEFQDASPDYNEAGRNCTDYIFVLAKEMGYVNY